MSKYIFVLVVFIGVVMELISAYYDNRGWFMTGLLISFFGIGMGIQNAINYWRN